MTNVVQWGRTHSFITGMKVMSHVYIEMCNFERYKFDRYKLEDDKLYLLRTSNHGRYLICHDRIVFAVVISYS